jgi:hypothetical protein
MDGYCSGPGNEECGACHTGFVLQPADNHIVSKRTSAGCRMQVSDKPQRHFLQKRSWKHEEAYSSQTCSHISWLKRREKVADDFLVGVEDGTGKDTATIYPCVLELDSSQAQNVGPLLSRG